MPGVKNPLSGLGALLDPRAGFDPQKLLDAAKGDPTSPLSDVLELDDTESARRYRVEQVRVFINRVGPAIAELSAWIERYKDSPELRNLVDAVRFVAEAQLSE